MNYFVGITKNKEWKLLSNGAETYEYIDPYSFSLKDAFEGKSNQIKKWSTSFDQLQFYCKKNNMKLLGPQEGGWFSQKIEHEVLEREFKLAKDRHLKWERILHFDQLTQNFLPKVQHDEKLSRWREYFTRRKIKSIDSMSGSDFEIAVKDIYKKQGFVASLTPTTGDYGVDVIAQSHDKKIAIQAKRYSNSVGVKAVQEAYSGALYYKATHAVVITNSVFTKNAINLARTLKVELIDKWKLAKIWLEAFPIQEIPIFDENHYQSIEPEITELIGRSLYDTEQIYMAKLLAAKKMNVGLTTWLYDLYSYTNNTRSMHYKAIKLGYTSKEEIDKTNKSGKSPAEDFVVRDHTDVRRKYIY